jgi:hypothetical protein
MFKTNGSQSRHILNYNRAGHWWLTPVILTTEEAEIRRIWSQLRQNSFQDPISKNLSQKRAGGVAQGVGPEFKPQYHKKQMLIETDKIVLQNAILIQCPARTSLSFSPV